MDAAAGVGAGAGAGAAAGVGVFVDLVSLTETERTMLLIFSVAYYCQWLSSRRFHLEMGHVPISRTLPPRLVSR